LLVSCNEDFLDRPAQGNLDASVLSTQDGVEGNLIAAYSCLDGWGGAGDSRLQASSNWVFGSAASDDAYKGSEPSDATTVTDIELYQWSTASSDGLMNDKWLSIYNAVSRCNATLSLMAQVEGIPVSDQNRIRGEAITLRAFYHFELWKVFKNIPYYTEEDEDFRKSNQGVDGLALCVADLDEAIGLLPEAQDEIGRATRWTAKAIKGKIQVFQEDWSGAVATLSDVVNNGPFDLEENFHFVWEATHDNGPETILAFQASANDGSSGGQNANDPNRLNFPHSGSPFGCCGFHQPTQNMVNVFKVDASGLPILDGSWNDADLTPDDVVDPRLDWTVGRDDVPFLDWGNHEAGWIRARAWAGPYSMKKTVYEQASNAESSVGWVPTQLHNMNLHLLRYADVMLLLAEAQIMTGDLNGALDLINQIRTRAAAGAQGPNGGPVVVPMDDAGITWATYDVQPYPSFPDADYALDALKMERRLELGMEGHRLFDLIRWGDAIEVINDYLAVESTRRAYLTGAATFEQKHMMYPIPFTQIELSTVEGEERLVQNPGW
jgi:hypothetical protein